MISELAHSYADSLSGIFQIYLNMSANQTSEIVKVLIENGQPVEYGERLFAVRVG